MVTFFTVQQIEIPDGDGFGAEGFAATGKGQEKTEEKRAWPP
jgi:hypothetical protein